MFRDVWKNIGGGRIQRRDMDQDLPVVMINLQLWQMVLIELPSSIELIDEICEWLEQAEFACICNNTSNKSRFYFIKEEDAVAFKLRWV